MSKRKRFIITSAVLSLGFVLIQFLDNQFRFLAIGVLGTLTVILFVWSLWEGLGKDMTLVSLVLPFLFTLGVGLFWFLLPSSILARLPVVILYAIGIYVLVSTSNVYTVAAIRTIPLLRTARGVGFVLTLLTSFLIFDTILSFKVPVYITSIAVFVFSFPLLLQGLWAIPLDKKIDRDLFLMALIFSLIMTEISVGLFFWPVTIVVGSLVFTVALYVLLGLGQAKLEERLFPQVIREYLVIGLIVFIAMFFRTSWSG